MWNDDIFKNSSFADEEDLKKTNSSNYAFPKYLRFIPSDNFGPNSKDISPFEKPSCYLIEMYNLTDQEHQQRIKKNCTFQRNKNAENENTQENAENQWTNSRTKNSVKRKDNKSRENKENNTNLVNMENSHKRMDSNEGILFEIIEEASITKYNERIEEASNERIEDASNERKEASNERKVLEAASNERKEASNERKVLEDSLHTFEHYLETIKGMKKKDPQTIRFSPSYQKELKDIEKERYFNKSIDGSIPLLKDKNYLINNTEIDNFNNFLLFDRVMKDGNWYSTKTGIKIEPNEQCDYIKQANNEPFLNSNEMYEINPSAQDNRTTCMIKNIPNNYSIKILEDVLNETHQGKYDFLYLRMDFEHRCNAGYAFVNFKDASDIQSFYKKINGMKWAYGFSKKIAKLTYARIQGFTSLIEKFKNSSIHEKEEIFRPKIFHVSGPQEGKERDWEEFRD